jgi:hypothetical protein
MLWHMHARMAHEHACPCTAPRSALLPQQQQPRRPPHPLRVASVPVPETASNGAASQAAHKEEPTAAATAADAAASSSPQSTVATVLLQCPDAKGVVASTAQLLFGFGCNIVSRYWGGTDRAESGSRLCACPRAEVLGGAGVYYESRFGIPELPQY